MASYCCQKCGKTMDQSQFYTYKDGRKTEMCKKCLTMHIDNFNPDTFVWLLQKLDLPYIEEEWNVLRDKAFAKDPYKMNGMSVFGKYLSKMKLNQWNKYSWADTEKLRAEKEQRLAIIKANQQSRDAQLKQQLEQGKISESEYKTLTSTETQNHDLMTRAPADAVGATNAFREENYMAEDELVDPAADLTQDDKLYLAMKWGRLYKPSEWVQLQNKYEEMTKSFDIQDADTANTLILICKTYLKMNQALDIGDLDGYQKLSRVYDTMRKSAKFTAAQNKDQKADFIDSLGQMVAYCQKVGGQIPKYEITTDYDIVDKIIRDMKQYTRSLVYEDTALAHQVEDYIKKREIAEAMKKDKAEARAKGQPQVQVTDADYTQHLAQIAGDRESDDQIYYGTGESEE